MIERPASRHEHEQKNPVLVFLAFLLGLLLLALKRLRHLVQTEGGFFVFAFFTTLVLALAVIGLGGAMIAILASI